MSAILNRIAGKKPSALDESDKTPQSEWHNSTPIIDFTTHIDDRKKHFKGRNGKGETVGLLPRKELKEYWTKTQIEAVCRAYKPSLVNQHGAIQHDALQLWSLLVYIRKPEFLDVFLQHNFSDASLPFVRPPEELSAPVFEDVWKGVAVHQWTFCPLVISPRLVGLRLQPQHVLPFYDETVLSEKKGASRVVRVKVHDACDEPDKSRKSKDRHLVLKSYTKRKEYLNESRNLSTLHTLHGKKNENVIGYYGSFVQKGIFDEEGGADRGTDSFNMLLQYVDGGNLLEMMEDKAPPETADQARVFWRSLFRTFEGLHFVHQLQMSQGGSSEYRGIHQDIKPDNILLAKGNSESPFDFSPLLADFGHSHIPPVEGDGDEAYGVDKRGNQTYCAPESSDHAPYKSRVLNHITSHADIFSMGCLLSEAAVWLAFGWAGVEEYQELRQAETKTVRNFKTNGGGGSIDEEEDDDSPDCFHNGVGVLKAVTAMHAKVVEVARKRDDELTPDVLRLIEDHLLLAEIKARSSASEIRERFLQLRGFTAMTSTFSRVAKAARLIQTRAVRPVVTTTGPVEGADDDEDEDGGARVPRTPDVVTPQDSDATVYGSPESRGTGAQQSPSLPSRRPLMSPIQLPPLAGSAAGEHGRRHSEPQGMHAHGNGKADQGRHHSLTVQGPELLSVLYRSISAKSSRSSLISEGGGGGPLAPFTIAQAGEWRANWKAKQPVDPDVHRSVRQLHDNLRGRHTIFFLEDSHHMQPHHDQVVDALQNLAYVVKHRPDWDPSKSGKDDPRTHVDLLFVSAAVGDSTQPLLSSEDTTKLVKAVKVARYGFVPGMVEDRFGWLVDNVVLPRLKLPPPSPMVKAGAQFESTQQPLQRKRSKSAPALDIRRAPLSVIVFTDGRSAGGMRNPVKRLTEKMKEYEVARTHVMVQFVRFGAESEGEKKLRELVELGKSMDCDIVDTQPVDGDVCSMLLGSLDRKEDAESSRE